MRKNQTKDEVRVLAQLKDALVAKFGNVEQDALVTDKPDGLFIIDGCRVACELRSISPQRIMAWHGIRMEDGDLLQVAFPIEPHMWVSHAVQMKAPKAQEYRQRTNANELWLILHGTSGAMGWGSVRL